jgi:snoRNA binding domain, fibrillarin
VAAAALVRNGAGLFLVGPDGRVASVAPGPTRGGATAAARVALAGLVRPPARGRPIPCDDPELAAQLRAAGVPATVGEPSELRAARERLPRPDVAALRGPAIDRAKADLARALADPVELLIVLSREEERLERAAQREEGAEEELGYSAGEPIGRVRASGSRLHGDLDRHLAVVRGEIEALAREQVPNLSALVGASLAGRLVAAAGSPRRLATGSAARLQLLGSRRRPSPRRGPRYGHLYRAPRMADVPPARRAAFARSLAALAVIAARADVFTHHRVVEELLRRRDRRVTALGRRP